MSVTGDTPPGGPGGMIPDAAASHLRAIAVGHPRPLLFATVSGAHLYGFASPDSDYDLRGVHLLAAEEVVGLVPGPETLERSSLDGGLDLDLVSHDAAKFFRLLLKNNGYVLEQLTSPLVVLTSPAHAAVWRRTSPASPPRRGSAGSTSWSPAR